jgi:[methyl-Co(III) methanol-specific corrinoid protein]:coenzyme M methyltransferase
MGLRAAGVAYQSAHSDAALMAKAAASTHALYGFESAVVPFDLCVEAEALGCAVDFQTDTDAFLAPVISQSLSWDDWQPEMITSGDQGDLLRSGRIPLVANALRLLTHEIGQHVAIGAWLPGPFTLAWQLFGAEAWLAGLAEPKKAGAVLDVLAELLARVGHYYREAGADFLTVHEMGGSPQVIGAKHFRSFVAQPLTRLMASLPPPRVLSICGATDEIVADMAATGADALHVDQRNDLARTRRVLGPAAVILGNFDPVQTLSQGTPAAIADSVQKIVAAGANAIWPGCDLWPDIPDENFRALMDAARLLA